MIVTNVSEEGNYTCVASNKAGTDKLELAITFTGCGRSCSSGCSKSEGRVENWYECRGTELSGDLKKCIPTTTTKLTLQGAKLRDLPAETFRYMDALNFLDLSSNEIQHLRPGVFANLSQLEYLLLHNNKLQTIPDEAFTTLWNIGLMILSDNAINATGTPAFLCPRKNLLIYMIRTELKTVNHRSFNGVHNPTAEISFEGGEIGTLKFGNGSRNCTVYLGSGGSDEDYIDISKELFKDNLLKIFTRTGFAKRIGDKYKLLPCPLGTFVNSSVSESSEVTCLECPAGGFYSDTKAFVGESCKKCPNGTFVNYSKAPGKSKHNCIACPKGTNTDSFAGFRACECLKNFHRTNLFEGCEPCPDKGVKCVYDSVTLLNGYWWKWKNQTHKELYQTFTDSLNEAKFAPISIEYPYRLPRPHKCPREQSCMGGLDSLCAKGYEGLLCDVCSAGHYKQLKTCKECPTKKWMIGQLSILAGVAATLIVIIVWMSKRKSKMAEGQSSVDIVLGRLKIVIGFYQVSSGVLEAFSYIQWPDSLALIGEYSAIVQLSIFQIAPLHCLFPNLKVDAFGSLFAILAVNAVAVVTAFFIYGLRKLTLTRNVLNGGERLKKTSEAKELIYRNLFFFLYVTYLNTCSSTASVLPLACRTICIDEKEELCYRVLKADFNIHCTSPKFKRLVIVAYCALVYILVLPTAAIVALWRKRASLGIQCNEDKTETNDAEGRSEEVVKGLQFLVQNYNRRSWYWELVETTRKVLLTSGLILVGGESRAYVGLACVMSGLYGIFFAFKGPIVDPFENRLMLSSLAVTFVNLGIGAVSRIPKEGIPSSIDPYLDNVMFNALVFGANSLVIGLLLVQYVIYIYCYMKEWRKNPQWSFSCCLALFLPLNDLQGEIRGLTGRNILKQQLQTGKIDMPSMSGAIKDSGVVNFGLQDETNGTGESSNGNMSKRNKSKRAEESVLTFANISIHDLPRQTYDTCL